MEPAAPISRIEGVRAGTSAQETSNKTPSDREAGLRQLLLKFLPTHVARQEDANAKTQDIRVRVAGQDIRATGQDIRVAGDVIHVAGQVICVSGIRVQADA